MRQLLTDIITFLKKMLNNIFEEKDEAFSDGALPDERSEKQREKDYPAEELLAGAPTTLGTKITETDIPLINQERTSSCVPCAIATAVMYADSKNAKNISRLALYRKRVNYAGDGSQGIDMFAKCIDGQIPYADMPFYKGITEATANALPYIKGTKLLPEFNYFPRYSFKDTFRYVSNGNPVVIFIYATREEWSKEYVSIIDPNLNPATAFVRHAVCLIPHGHFTENGKIWYSVHDSASFGGRLIRYVDTDFLEKRIFFEAGVSKVESSVVMPLPIIKPTVACKKGDKNNTVLNLQNFLIAGGFLEPKYNTSYYGSLTAKAVLWWQLQNWEGFKEKGYSIPELLELNGEWFGRVSIITLNK